MFRREAHSALRCCTTIFRWAECLLAQHTVIAARCFAAKRSREVPTMKAAGGSSSSRERAQRLPAPESEAPHVNVSTRSTLSVAVLRDDIQVGRMPPRAAHGYCGSVLRDEAFT